MYEECIQDARQLLRSVTEFVNGLEVYPRHNVYKDVVLLALVSKAIRVGEAVCLLVEQGFHDEAFGVSRTLVDLGLSVRYIVNDPGFDQRSGRYVKYFAKDHENWSRLIQKYYPTMAVKYHPKHDEMLDIARTFRSPHIWHQGTTRDMAIEDDLVEKDEHGTFRQKRAPIRLPFGVCLFCTRLVFRDTDANSKWASSSHIGRQLKSCVIVRSHTKPVLLGCEA
jgi:hypothetical protein